MTPEAVVSRLQVLAATVTGINAAPDTIPDNIAVFPAALSRLETYEEHAATVGNDNLMWVAITEIHVARKDLPRDYAALDGLGALFVAAVRLDSRSNAAGSLGVIASAIGDQSGQVVATNWGDSNTLAWFCRVPFKIQQ